VPTEVVSTVGGHGAGGGSVSTGGMLSMGDGAWEEAELMSE